MHGHRTSLPGCPRLRQQAASAGWPHQRTRRPSFARSLRRSWTCLEHPHTVEDHGHAGQSRAQMWNFILVQIAEDAHSSARVRARARVCMCVCVCDIRWSAAPGQMVPVRAHTHAYTRAHARHSAVRAALRTGHIMQSAPRRALPPRSPPSPADDFFFFGIPSRRAGLLSGAARRSCLVRSGGLRRQALPAQRFRPRTLVLSSWAQTQSLPSSKGK